MSAIMIITITTVLTHDPYMRMPSPPPPVVKRVPYDSMQSCESDAVLTRYVARHRHYATVFDARCVAK